MNGTNYQPGILALLFDQINSGEQDFSQNAEPRVK